MMDVVYVVITVAFFVLMLGYIRGCQVLGASGVRDGRES